MAEREIEKAIRDRDREEERGERVAMHGRERGGGERGEKIAMHGRERNM